MYPLQQALVPGAQRQMELTLKYEMGQVRRQHQLRHRVEHLEGVVEIVQQAVAVGFEKKLDAHGLRFAEPAVNERQGARHRYRHNLGDGIDLDGAGLQGELKQRLHLTDAAREEIHHALEAVLRKQR